MLRAIYHGARILTRRNRIIPAFYSANINVPVISRNYSSLLNRISINPVSQLGRIGLGLSENAQILSIAKSMVPVRTVTKYSLTKGKRRTVKVALHRFFRLHWGGWIHTKCGRHKKMWKKSPAQKRRLRQHVFCNATQSTLLDKMVTKFWKRPKYYVDDPYAPYHTREEFWITRKKPIVRD